MKSIYIRNCGNDHQIVKVLPNSSISVNEKCEAISNVCTDVKQFSRASVSSTREFSRGGLVQRGTCFYFNLLQPKGTLRVQKNTVVFLNTTHPVCDTKKANEMVRGSLAAFGIKGCSMPEVWNRFSMEHLCSHPVIYREFTATRTKKWWHFLFQLKLCDYLAEEVLHSTKTSNTTRCL